MIMVNRLYNFPTLKRFASAGSCLDISPPMKTASKYAHKFCTVNHFAKISEVLPSLNCHSWILFLKGVL